MLAKEIRQGDPREEKKKKKKKRKEKLIQLLLPIPITLVQRNKKKHNRFKPWGYSRNAMFQLWVGKKSSSINSLMHVSLDLLSPLCKPSNRHIIPTLSQTPPFTSQTPTVAALLVSNTWTHQHTRPFPDGSRDRKGQGKREAYPQPRTMPG